MDRDGEYRRTAACPFVESSLCLRGLIDMRRRLQANDRVDPYVAVYSPPAPFTIGDMVHIRWHGFLTPRFVQRVIDTATCVAFCLFYDCGTNSRRTRTRTLLSRRMSTSSSIAFVGLTIHGSPWVPVLTPHRVPRLEGEDTASIILASEGVGNAMIGESASANEENSLSGSWVMLESIGKWDSRFG
jgi:ribonucleases P/MRP protein subunit RPP40